MDAQKQAAKQQPAVEPPDAADLAFERDDGREVPRCVRGRTHSPQRTCK